MSIYYVQIGDLSFAQESKEACDRAYQAAKSEQMKARRTVLDSLNLTFYIRLTAEEAKGFLPVCKKRTEALKQLRQTKNKEYHGIHTVAISLDPETCILLNAKKFAGNALIQNEDYPVLVPYDAAQKYVLDKTKLSDQEKDLICSGHRFSSSDFKGGIDGSLRVDWGELRCFPEIPLRYMNQTDARMKKEMVKPSYFV
jgi:hypothetical protein